MNNHIVDKQYMEQAIDQGRQALAIKEVPIGAVIVDSKGLVIGAAYNQVESCKTQTAHAELLALAQAAQVLSDWRLTGCVLYVTLEPCAMCYAAAQLSRLDLIVFGAPSPLFGYVHEQDRFLGVASMKVPVLGGVKQEACAQLLQEFFKKQRTSNENRSGQECVFRNKRFS